MPANARRSHACPCTLLPSRLIPALFMPAAPQRVPQLELVQEAEEPTVSRRPVLKKKNKKKRLLFPHVIHLHVYHLRHACIFSALAVVYRWIHFSCLTGTSGEILVTLGCPSNGLYSMVSFGLLWRLSHILRHGSHLAD